MKRRTILMSTVAAAAAGLTTKGNTAGTETTIRTSRYGQAGSYSSDVAVQRLGITRFTLSMSKAGVPAQAISSVTAIVNATTDLMTSRVARNEFIVNPSRFLSQYNIDGLTLGSPANDTVDVAVLRGLISEEVRSSIQSGDVGTILRAINNSCTVRPGLSHAQLSENLSLVMKKNSRELAPIIEQLRKRFATQNVKDMGGLEFEVLADMLTRQSKQPGAYGSVTGPDPYCSVAAVGCVAWIAVVAYTYIIAAAALIAAVTIATKVGVFGPIDEGFAGPGQLMSKFAPEEIKRYTIAVKMAKAQGREDVISNIYEHLYKKEVILIVDALERSGHFSFPGEARKGIEQAMIKYLGASDSIGG